LRASVSLVGGFAIPPCSFGVVLGNTLAVGVCKAEVVLGVSMSLFSGFTPPPDGIGPVVIFQLAPTEPELGWSVSMLRLRGPFAPFGNRGVDIPVIPLSWLKRGSGASGRQALRNFDAADVLQTVGDARGSECVASDRRLNAGIGEDGDALPCALARPGELTLSTICRTRVGRATAGVDCARAGSRELSIRGMIAGSGRYSLHYRPDLFHALAAAGVNPVVEIHGRVAMRRDELDTISQALRRFTIDIAELVSAPAVVGAR
jgi:hypothetical protein